MEKPSHLYKYAPVSIRTLENLQSNTVYFGSPKQFNDPYDCALTPVMSDLTISDTRIIMNSYGITIHDDEHEDFRNRLSNAAKKVVQKSNNEFLGNRGVSCFSETNDNLLMWAHYASNCTGICLEFSTSSELFAIGHKVEYCRSMPEIETASLLTGQNHTQIMKLFCSKSEHWSYEKEWRIIHKEAGTRFHYHSNDLTGVYFGPDVSEEILNIICLILQGNNETVRFWKGARSSTEFKVEFVEFKYISHVQAISQGLKPPVTA